MDALRRNWLKLPLFLLIAAGPGCTRRFFRERADEDVCHLLTEKNQFDAWKIEQFHVYPDGRARFADPTNPDRPPMPPDDPAAAALSPRSQKPGRPGVGLFEGTGYVELITAWDSMNRQDMNVLPPPDPVPSAQGGDTEAGPGVKPYLLTLDQVCELGLFNSREFQDQRETLYVTALPVSLQRFAFAAMFTSTGDAFRESDGSQTAFGRRERWRGDVNNGVTKLFPTGALLLAQFANQISLEMLNGRPNTSVSNATIQLTQPLLRGGGLAVTLEPLTQAERNLLYGIRSYARFRKSFYVSIAGGSNDTTQSTSDLAASLGFSAGSITPPAGFLPTVLRSGQLDVDHRNVASLRELLQRFEAFAEGGQVSQLQVDQVKQSLLRARSSVLQDELQYRNTLDNLKRQLGLPPCMLIEPDISALRPMTKMLDRYQQVIDQYTAAQEEAERDLGADKAAQVRDRFKAILRDNPLLAGTAFRESAPKRMSVWEIKTDAELTKTLLALRDERRLLLARRTKLETDRQVVPDELRRRLTELENELSMGTFEDTLRTYEKRPWLPVAEPEARERRRLNLFRIAANAFALVLTEPRYQRFEKLAKAWPPLAPLIVDDCDLLAAPLDQAYCKASQTALTNRLDLMNARGQLVDSWRQVAVRANGLLGVLDVQYNLTSATRPDRAEPFGFSSTRTTQRFGFNWELPLVRRNERNNYRVGLINFQRQRRSLQATEDNILIAVRGELRQLRVFAETYRIQQEQVELAYAQVENALDTFAQPSLPTDVSSAGNAAALTQQILNAQQSLNQAQSQLYTIWITYLTTRMQLYRDLELLPLDARGVWIDEYLSPDRAPDKPDAHVSPDGERLPQPRPTGAAPVGGGR